MKFVAGEQPESDFVNSENDRRAIDQNHRAQIVTIAVVVDIDEVHFRGARDWRLHIPVCQQLLNETKRGESSYSPSQLLFGPKFNHSL